MRIFRSEDGAELREEDVRELAHHCRNCGRDLDIVQRVEAALAPRRCGAIIVWSDKKWGETTMSCILPPGHHPFGGRYLTICDALECKLPLEDPIHSPGHLIDRAFWNEPNPPATAPKG